MSPSVKTAQVSEPGLSRNFVQGVARAVVGVAVLWMAMHFFFAWQDGKDSGAVAQTKVMPTVTTSR